MPITPSEIFEAVWTALQKHYPMLEFMGADGDAWLNEFRPKVAQAATPDEAFDYIEELVCRLNDYHTWFARPGRKWRFDGLKTPPGVRADIVSDVRRKVVAIVEIGPDAEAAGVRIGDEILSVNGTPVKTALVAKEKLVVGSMPEARSRNACWQILLGPPDAPLHLTLRSTADSTSRDVTLSRSPEQIPASPPVVACREVEGIPVIKITRWASPNDFDIVAVFDQYLEQYRESPYLIVDVRGNGGGNDHVADQVTGRFLTEPVISSIFFLREPATMRYERHIWRAQPRGPWRFTGRYALLIDEGCMSACEHFTSGMLAGGACLIGGTTNGACGGTQIIELPGDTRMCISRVFDLHGVDPSARHGIRPHLPAPLQLSDLHQGRDGAMEAAIRWLTSGKKLPRHPQRLVS